MMLKPESLSGLVAHLEELREAEGHGRTAASLAEAYRLQGRVEDAVRVARQASDDLPGNVAVRIALARALDDAGDPEGAARTYRDALTLDPENLEALAALGEPRQEACPAVEPPTEPEPRRPGSLSEELAHLSELFVESPPHAGEQEGDAIATLTLAEIYARQGLLERAIRICEVLAERNPEDASVSGKLAEYRRELESRKLERETAPGRR